MFDTPQVYSWKDPASKPHEPALQCHFINYPEVNVEATAATGVQTYDNLIVMHIYPAGQPKSDATHEIERTLPDGTVKQTRYALKYAEAFKKYKSGLSSEETGTPLKDLIGMNAATIMNLKSRGIHTIEVLADLQDSVGHDLMGFYELRDKAKKHIEHREKNAPMLRMEAIEEKHKAEVDSLKRQLADLAAMVERRGDEEPIAPRRGPGRPRNPPEQEAA